MAGVVGVAEGAGEAAKLSEEATEGGASIESSLSISIGTYFGVGVAAG